MSTTSLVSADHRDEHLVPIRQHKPSFFQIHRRSLILCGALLVMVGIVHALNFHGWPGRVNDDEGTYVAQAWAIIYQGSLAHYTYAYDHPPLGWILIALYAWLTDGFDRTSTALMVGRELMLVQGPRQVQELFALTGTQDKFDWVPAPS